MIILHTLCRYTKCILRQKPTHRASVIRYISTDKNRIRVKMENEPLPPSRDDPIIMKLDTPVFHSIFTPELNTLSDLFKKYDYALRIAGGAVRDILMDLKPTDLDFATNATPDQMKDMFTKEEIRLINTKGERHGTITARINDKENFEVTTLRIDVVTDGRHAEVKFTTNWKLDANRRDLTINSMFLDLEGNVYDYFYGYDDLQKRRVVFVGDPTRRIQEDFLRILRYFRFYGRISESPDNFDEKTINAIKENVAGLQFISGERIWSEWSKILDRRYGKELTLKMIECGVAPYIGLPKEPNVENFKTVYDQALNNSFKLRPITLITSMLKDEEEVMALHNRLKLSAYDRDLALFLVQHRELKLIECSENPLRPYQLLILNPKVKMTNTRDFVCEVLKYRGAVEYYNKINEWFIPKFPINGHVVRSNVPHGKMVGPILSKLKEIWFDSNFTISGDELKKRIPQIVDDLKENIK